MGLMQCRPACVNDLPIKEVDPKFHWDRLWPTTGRPCRSLRFRRVNGAFALQSTSSDPRLGRYHPCGLSQAVRHERLFDYQRGI
jgi:hypothetical protein